MDSKRDDDEKIEALWQIAEDHQALADITVGREQDVHKWLVAKMREEIRKLEIIVDDRVN